MSLFKIESIAELIPCNIIEIPDGFYEGLVRGDYVAFAYDSRWFIIFCRENNRYCEDTVIVKIENNIIEVLPKEYKI